MSWKRNIKSTNFMAAIIVIIGVSVYGFANKNIDNILNISQENLFESGRIIHISFDDTIEVFFDLTQNEEKYVSIFENEFLGFLKEMHDEYEAVFSLYCFYQNADGTFNLSMCTDKFVNEFKVNSEWLKVGFHNMNEHGNLVNATAEEAEEAYGLIISELIRITGGKESLDRVVRLQNFAGNAEVITALAECENGIEGLYTADDERQSYFLEESDNLYIYTHDYLKEDELDIVYISTDKRLENSLNVYKDLEVIAENDNQNKIIEIFTHEWKCNDRLNFELTKHKIEACCKFAKKYGYKWNFVRNSEIEEVLSVS